MISLKVNITTADEDHCQKTSDFSTITSISIRNKEEYELVKMLYRCIFLISILLHSISTSYFS